MLFAAARCLFFVLRCAPRPRCARPVCCPSRLPPRFSLRGFGRCAAGGLVLPALRGLRRFASSVPVSLRCTGSCVTCSSVRWTLCFSQGFALGWVGPPWLVVLRWWRLRRAVRYPAWFSCRFTDCSAWSGPELCEAVVRGRRGFIRFWGCAPFPLHLRRRLLRRRPTFHCVILMFLRGLRPSLSGPSSVVVHAVFLAGLRLGPVVLPWCSCSGESTPAAGGDRRGFLCGSRSVSLGSGALRSNGQKQRWIYSRLGCAPSCCRYDDSVVNELMRSCYAPVAVTADSRTGVTNRPRHHPLRSNTSHTTVHHEAQLHAPLPAPQASSQVRQAADPTTHTTGAKPPPRRRLPPTLYVCQAPTRRPQETCSRRYTIYTEGKSRRCRKPGVAGYGESGRQFRPPRSPESA
jgi:hypothetical protein